MSEDTKLIETITSGGVAIVATDTIYGIVGQALKPKTVQRIYTLKKRTPTKPFIILISDVVDVEKFSVVLSDEEKEVLESYWPGPVSIILDCNDDAFEYLHRGSKSLAFRLPAKQELRELVAKTGPLVAPSANPEGLEPAKTIEDAKDYFGDSVDYYLEGETNTKPSTIIRITGGEKTIIRP